MNASATIAEVSPAETTVAALPWETSTAAALDSETTQRLIATLPEDTFQLIVREAYLFRAGQIIFQAMNEAKIRHESVAATRPSFLAFCRPGRKESFRANLTKATEDLSLYESAVRRNVDTMTRLRRRAEPPIANWLRENDATFQTALVAEKFATDWQAGVTRLESKLSAFIDAVSFALKSLGSSQAGASGFVSDAGRNAITQAARAGILFANDVKAVNAIADARDRYLQGTVAAFPRLPNFDFVTTLAESIVLPAPFLRQQFGLILDQCHELRSQGLPTLGAQQRQADAPHVALKESHLAGIWQALREFSVAHYVDEADLSEVAEATEAMFENAG